MKLSLSDEAHLLGRAKTSHGSFGSLLELVQCHRLQPGVDFAQLVHQPLLMASKEHACPENILGDVPQTGLVLAHRQLEQEPGINLQGTCHASDLVERQLGLTLLDHRDDVGPIKARCLCDVDLLHSLRSELTNAASDVLRDRKSTS